MDSKPSRSSTPLAVLIGLAGAIAIWIITPFNSLVIGNANITESFLPGIVLLITLVLVLAVNPLLRLIGRAGLSTPQLALAVGLMLIACTVPGGTFNSLVRSLARTPSQVQRDPAIARQYENMNLPASMFPDSTRPGAPTTASEQYFSGLRPGERLPWGAWLGPLLCWGAFLAAAWMMMVGLSMVMFPQWRNNERLAFPLLAVQQSLIEAPEPGEKFPPLLKTRSFWIAVGAIMIIYAMFGLNKYSPESVPQIPLEWNFSTLFASEPWQSMPGYMREGRIYFMIIGMAFFMPSRISFSIAFFLIVYGLYRGLAPVFGWRHYIERTDDQRYGAVIMLTLCVLWIGRSQWAAVFGSMFRRGGSAVDRRNRVSGWVFTVGILGMFAWMCWVGFGQVRAEAETAGWLAGATVRAIAVNAGWAAIMVAFAFMVSLLIARIVAETGMPFVRLYEQPLVLMEMAPVAWLSAVWVFMAIVIDLLISLGSRISPAAMSMHVIGLDETASPRRQGRLGVGLVGVMLVGLVVAGASNLLSSYHNTTTWNNTPVHGGENHLANANNALKEVERRAGSAETLESLPYNRAAQFGIGAVLAAVLYWLCLAVPSWPIHPFGLMLVDSYYGHLAWGSIFIGWLLQMVIVKYGGARLYRRARPVFLGLIIGEVLASAVWAVAPIVLTMMGRNYIPVQVMPT